MDFNARFEAAYARGSQRGRLIRLDTPLRRDMRDWQEQTGEQIVADVFDQHPQAQGAYRFDLREAMPQYSNRVQWEDDWTFVHRSLEEAATSIPIRTRSTRCSPIR